MPPKRDSRLEQGSKRAPNSRTRRSAERAAKHAQVRAQAEDRLWQLDDKMAKASPRCSAGGLAKACGPRSLCSQKKLAL